MKNAIICARVSDEDSTNERLEDQLAECRRWAEENGYTVVHEVAENGVSGGKPIRQRADAFNALEQLRGGQVQVVIWREIDRMGRRFDTAETIEEYQRYGDGIVFARQPRPDDPTAQILQVGMGATLARWERANIYQRTARGRNRLAREGQPFIGKLPRWLRWDPKAAAVVLVEDEARKISSILADYGANGLHTLSTKYDMNPASLHKILTNTAIAGRRYVPPLAAEPLPKAAQQKKRRTITREISLASTPSEADAIAERHGLIRQDVPPLISWERFREIQVRLIEMSRVQRGRPPKHPMPLQKRIRCGKHDLAYTPSWGNGRVYAECSARRGFEAHRYGRCDHPRFPWLQDTKRARSIVSLVTEVLEGALDSPEAIELATKRSEGYVMRRIEELKATTGNIDEDLSKLQAKKSRLALLWMDGDLPQETWQREKERLDRNIEGLRKRAASLDKDRRELTAMQGILKRMQEFPDPPFRTDVAFWDVEQLADYLDLKIVVEHDRLQLFGLIPLPDHTLEKSPKDKAEVVKPVKSSCGSSPRPGRNGPARSPG